MDVVVYVRISQDRTDEGAGVDRQERDCRSLAESLDWNVVHVYRENNTSASAQKRRPEYQAMLKRLDSGAIGGVVAWHPDRLYRKLEDLGSLIEVCKARGVEIRTVKAGQVELSTASGIMTAEILASVAKHETARLGERVKAAKDAQAAEGRFRGGGRAFGYMNGYDIEPAEAAEIRRSAELLLGGASLMSYVRDMNRRGVTTVTGKPWTVTAWRKVLRRARNAAIVERDDGTVVGPAKWPAIFDQETMHAVRAILDDPSRITATSYERKYIGRGLYLCGRCGATMEPVKMNARHGNRRGYRCSNTPHVTVMQEPIDELVAALAIARLTQVDAADLFRESDNQDTGALQIERDGLQARKDALAGMFATGDIDAAQLKRGTVELNTRIAALDAQLAAARETHPLGAIVGVDDVAAVWEMSSVDARAKIVDALMTVTVQPVGSGWRGSVEDRVQIDWRH